MLECHGVIRFQAIDLITYWLVGRRIVEQEQHGASRAGYGDELIERVSIDLQARPWKSPKDGKQMVDPHSKWMRK